MEKADIEFFKSEIARDLEIYEQSKDNTEKNELYKAMDGLIQLIFSFENVNDDDVGRLINRVYQLKERPSFHSQSNEASSSSGSSIITPSSSQITTDYENAEYTMEDGTFEGHYALVSDRLKNLMDLREFVDDQERKQTVAEISESIRELVDIFSGHPDEYNTLQLLYNDVYDNFGEDFPNIYNEDDVLAPEEPEEDNYASVTRRKSQSPPSKKVKPNKNSLPAQRLSNPHIPKSNKKLEIGPNTNTFGNVIIRENETGHTWHSIFGKHINSQIHQARFVTEVTIEDPYIRNDYQFRNLKDFINFVFDTCHFVEKIILVSKIGGDNLAKRSSFNNSYAKSIQEIKRMCREKGVSFLVESKPSIHDRYIKFNHGVIASMGRGIDKDGKLSKDQYANKPYYTDEIKQERDFLNLMEHFDTFVIKKDEVRDDTRINVLNKLTVRNKSLKDVLKGAQFYGSLGAFTKIGLNNVAQPDINLVFVKRDAVILVLEDTFELSQPIPEILPIRGKSHSYNSKVESYIGLKFVSYFTTQNENRRNFDDPIFEAEHFRRIFYTTLMKKDDEDIKIAYSVVTNCVDPETDKNMIIKTQSVQKFNPYKQAQIWMTATFTSANKCVVGVRTGENMLESIEVNEVDNLTRTKAFTDQEMYQKLYTTLQIVKAQFEEHPHCQFVNLTKKHKETVINGKVFLNVPSHIKKYWGKK
uniref:Decapping nuclease n=1 Tax=Rhabditophanes sp. KR3021 TaxID=114890 RepID=A0AC35TH97_9BILA